VAPRDDGEELVSDVPEAAQPQEPEREPARSRTAAAGGGRTAIRTAKGLSTAEPNTRSGVPTLREERRLLRTGHALLAGMDEVGRGALAGPVTVGVVVVDLASRTAPNGVRDSKLLAPAAREALVPRLRRWARAYAVGHAEPEEVDAYGIIAALRLAGRRALASLPALPSCVLLDGNHNWLTGRPPPDPVEEALFPLEAAAPVRLPAPPVELAVEPVVRTMIKADLRCAAVAAASVLAKVERDRIMVERARRFPGYGWEENKGYSAPEHSSALRRLGPCEQHRRTWSLPLGEVPGLSEVRELTEVSDLPEVSGLAGVSELPEVAGLVEVSLHEETDAVDLLA
jgi:ribonuclease HII